MTKSNNKLDQIIKSAEKAVQYNHDPETALMYSRRATEAICKDLYDGVFKKSPGRLTFNDLIGDLTKRNALPRKVIFSMRVIQNIGNSNAHPDENIDECLKPALEFFSIIVNWYFQDYKKIDVPEQIKFRKANEVIFPSEAKMVEPLPIADFEDETVVSEKPSKFSRPKTRKSKPEATMSNPHYQNDLKVIDEVWDLAQVISSETIFVLSGCNLIAELLDRPVAEMLRDEIDRLGNPKSFRRAIVITDWWWWQEAMDKAHPLIAVGGSATNGMTREILEKVEAQEDENGFCTAFVYEDFPKVAVWGETATQNKESVEQFIRNDLRSFLNECWK